MVVLRCVIIIGLCAALGYWAGSARAQAPAAEVSEELVIFMDCSGSMSTPVGGTDARGRRRYHYTLDWAMEDARVHLESGAAVRVVPFDEVPRERTGQLFTPGAQPVQTQLAQIRFLLEAWGPKEDLRRTAIWDSIADVIPRVVRDGRQMSIAVYTDGEDNASRRTQAQLEAELRKLGPFAEREWSGIRVWTWGEQRVLAPRVAVEVVVDKPVTIRLNRLLGKAAAVDIPVKARFWGESVTDRVYEVSAEILPRKPGAPALAIRTAKLSSPLTPSRRDGQVNLELAGDLQGGLLQQLEYELRLSFRFQSQKPKLDKADREQVIPGSRSVPVVVYSEHTVRIQAVPAELQMLPGQSRKVDLALSGGEESAGLKCELRVLAPKGIEAALTLEADAEPTRDSLLLTIPKAGQTMPAMLRLRATDVVDGRVQVSAVVQNVDGVQDRREIAVHVEQPLVRVRLLRSGQPTTLNERENVELWQELGSGPVVAQLEGDPGPAKLRMAFHGEDADVQLAFDKEGRQSSDLPLAEVAAGRAGNIPVYARWRAGRTPTTQPTLPTLRSEIVDQPGYEIRIQGKELAFPNAVGLAAPDFWLRPAQEEGAGIEPRQRTVRFTPQRLLASATFERIVILEWNAGMAATPATISVRPLVEGGLEAIGMEVISPEGSKGMLMQKGPWELDTTPAQARDRSGRVKLTFKAPSRGDSTGNFDVAFAAALPSGASIPSPWQVRGACEVAAPVFTIALDRGQHQRTPVFPGARDAVGTMRVTSDVSCAATLRASFDPASQGDSPTTRPCIAFSFEDSSRPETDLPQASSKSLVLLAEVSGGDGASAGPIDGHLVLELSSDDTSAVIQVQGQAAQPLTRSLRLPFQFDVRTWTLRITAAGKEIAAIPPRGDPILIDGPNVVHSTEKYSRPIEFSFVGAAKMPADLRQKALKAEVVDGRGVLREVSFVTEKGPVPAVALGDLASIKGVRLKAGATPDWFGDQRPVEGVIRFNIPGFGAKNLRVRMAIEPRLPLAAIILVALAAVILLFLWYLRRNRAVQVMAGEPVSNMPEDSDELLRGVNLGESSAPGAGPANNSWLDAPTTDAEPRKDAPPPPPSPGPPASSEKPARSDGEAWL